jgi:hypothetical protein
MPTLLRRLALFTALAAAPLAASVVAQAGTAHDVRATLAHQEGAVAARALIERQLLAFERGDADVAFATTAPELKESYVNSASFMDSVRAKYTAFVHHRVAEFGVFIGHGDVAEQGLTLVDDDSEVWTVVYHLIRQPNGSWLIGAVLLVRADATDA